MKKNALIDDFLSNAVSLANNNKYIEALNVIQSILRNDLYVTELDSYDWQIIGNVCLFLPRYDLAYNAYLKANNYDGAAFVLILVNKFEEANKLLTESKLSPANLWCRFLIELFSDVEPIKHYPTYFVIRHFMEFTVYCLLISHNQLYIKKLLSSLKKLLEINPDSEKLIGYAYSQYGNFEEAIKFLKNSLKRDNEDGEIYYKLGQIYNEIGNYKEASSMLKKAIKSLPDHYPSKLLFDKVALLLSK